MPTLGVELLTNTGNIVYVCDLLILTGSISDAPNGRKEEIVPVFMIATVLFMQYSANNAYLRNSVEKNFNFPFPKSWSKVRVFVRLQIPGI